MQPSLGPLEQHILELVWKYPAATGRELHIQATKHQKLAYTTIMTILNRLVEKKLVVRSKSGRTFRYTPKQSQRQFIHAAVHGAVTSLIGRFGEEAIAAFISETSKLSQADKETLVKTLQSKRSSQKK